jgi:membrane protein DedA with SNARE-associated domain
VSGLVERFGYAAIVLLLVGGGVGVPVPEELIQLTAGFAAHEGPLRLGLAVLASWLGIVAGDSIFFVIARRHGSAVLGMRAVRRVLTPARREQLVRHYARHAFLTVMVSRHLSALRLAAYALAALHGVPLRTFVLADGLSAMLSVPLVVGAGYLFSAHLAQARRDVRIAEIAVLGALIATAAVVVAYRRRRTRRPKPPGGDGVVPP